jgi:hypothetical protein
LRDRFDSDGDGKIDQQEWEVARQEACLEVQQIHDQPVLEPDTHIIAKPKNSMQPFIISVYPHAILTRKYRRTAYIALVTCMTLIGYIAWLIHAHR